MTRRDKSNVKILGAFNGPAGIPMTRVDDLSKLGIPDPLLSSMAQEVSANQMLWEVWIESNDSYPDLRKKLMNRGYVHVPGHYTMKYHLPVKKNAGDEQRKSLSIKTPKVVKMLRKGN